MTEQVKLHVSESTATIRQWIENGTWQLMIGKSLMIAIADELDANRLRIAELEAENAELKVKLQCDHDWEKLGGNRSDGILVECNKCHQRAMLILKKGEPFKGVGEQHVYPAPKQRLVREGD